ncbi:MAG: peptidase [Naasia sp.]|nr:peptidase [Naasia sp.]
MPSHGSDLFGERYAIDFVAVDNRSTAIRDRRTLFGTEPPDRFVGFGRPILAPTVPHRTVARGLPIAFRRYREEAQRSRPVDREFGVPGGASVVATLGISGSRA